MFDDEKLRVTLNIAGEQVKTVINLSLIHILTNYCISL